MAIAAARRLPDRAVCFVGIGLPSKAANLARATHAPDCVLIYESGCIGAKPVFLPLSIGDGELAETADAVVSVPEIFAYWLQAGRIDIGFLGAAQIDRYGNLNSTVVGDYARPKVRLPGAGGAPGDRGLVPGDVRDVAPDAARVRRAARFPDVRRTRRRSGIARAPRVAGGRRDRRRHGPGGPRTRPAVVRAGPDAPASGMHRGRGPRGDRLAAPRGGGRGVERRADARTSSRRCARCAPRSRRGRRRERDAARARRGDEATLRGVDAAPCAPRVPVDDPPCARSAVPAAAAVARRSERPRLRSRHGRGVRERPDAAARRRADRRADQRQRPRRSTARGGPSGTR